MIWIGKWKNQFGSILEITDESGHKVAGRFRRSMKDRGISAEEISVSGVRFGNCLGLSGGKAAGTGEMVVNYTGMLDQDKLKTLWYVVADSALSATDEGAHEEFERLDSWRGMTTRADTFERIA
jgi:hypothetical protein